MGIVNYIKENPTLKKFIHWTIVKPGQSKPRGWVTFFVNPFLHKRGRKSRISATARLDLLPFNNFEMGKRSRVEDYATLNNGIGDLILEDDVFIGLFTVVLGPLEIKKNTIIGQHVVISGLNHEYEDPNLPISEQGIFSDKITIGEDCMICANSVITAGVTIGKHCVVGAGAVVTKDVPDYSIVGGNPAKVLKQYSFETKKWERV